jgi:hypothetical protein
MSVISELWRFQMAIALMADFVARVPRLRFRGLGLLIAVAIYLVLCALVGLWAGHVAQNRGRQFSLYFAIAFIVSLCGLLPGIVVVIVAYAQGPSTGTPPQMPGASGAPPGGQYTPVPPPLQPPPSPPQAPPPPPPVEPQASGQVKQNPDGGYEYTPPPPPPR